MKRIFVFLVVAVAIFIVGTSAFAAQSNIVLFEQKEITDENVLIERIVNNVSDANLSDVPFSYNPQMVIQNPEGEQSIANAEYTIQLLKREQTQYGNIVESYALTSAVLLDKEMQPISLQSLAGSGSRERTGKDSTSSVSAICTIYFDYFPRNGEEFCNLTKVTGSWAIINDNPAISNRCVYYGQVVTSPAEQAYKYPTTNSFSYNTGFTKGVGAAMGSSELGMFMSCTLTRGTAVWSFELSNNTTP